jgi:hypothetical protein
MCPDSSEEKKVVKDLKSEAIAFGDPAFLLSFVWGSRAYKTLPKSDALTARTREVLGVPVITGFSIDI